ncbi:MAG: dinitrogenase iron-molybdenum cofactor biosynthesis protein [Firmicutes bacterium]|nr:dinitrogenase iron-molybdenum cofactor biosynthesis protein [Bacillota bacterium]
MKIAIPVNNKSMESTIASSFGRTPYFLIYDTETQTNAFFDNSAIASQGGAGIKAAQAIVDSGAGAVLVPQCGENAASVLKTANMKIYKTMNDSIKDNIVAFNAGTLSLLDAIHAGFHNHGGK